MKKEKLSSFIIEEIKNIKLERIKANLFKNKKENLFIFLILSIVFTILKLFSVINWSWLWILSPLWILLIIIILITIIPQIFLLFLSKRT
jgi:membrane protein YdbS with pleckstrin-like domain